MTQFTYAYTSMHLSGNSSGPLLVPPSAAHQEWELVETKVVPNSIYKTENIANPMSQPGLVTSHSKNDNYSHILIAIWRSPPLPPPSDKPSTGEGVGTF
jgi:hypothetical protein